MTNTYSTEHEQGGGHPEQHGGKPGRGGDKPFEVTVRTMAGHSRKDTVKPSDTVAEVTGHRPHRDLERLVTTPTGLAAVLLRMTAALLVLGAVRVRHGRPL